MIFFYPLVLLVFLLDQGTKILVEKNFLQNQTLPLVKNIFHLTLVHNKGAAFGILQDYGLVLLFIGTAVMGLVLYFHYRVPARNYLVQLALAFILGGSLGNVLDRIRFGYVVDFIDFRVWPVFNLADTFINVGVVLLVFYLIWGERKNVSNSN